MHTDTHTRARAHESLKQTEAELCLSRVAHQEHRYRLQRKKLATHWRVAQATTNGSEGDHSRFKYRTPV